MARSRSPRRRSLKRKSPPKRRSVRRKSPSKRRSVRRKSPSKTSRSRRRCPRGQILRKGYTRKAYTRKDGTRVKAVRVKANCILDKGLPGKGPKVIPKLRKGLLTQYGYHATDTVAKRHLALDKAVKAYGGASVIRKLNAIYVLNRNTNPSMAAKFKVDRNWVSKKYASMKRRSPRKSTRRKSPKRKVSRRRR